MIRVLHVLTDSNIGGAGHHLLALLSRENGLDRSAFEVLVVLPTGARLTPLLAEEGIKCEEVSYLAERSFSAKSVIVLLEQMKRFKPHIVHTHAALSARVAARIYKKCKIIHTRHSVFEPKPMNFPVKQLVRFFNNYFSDAIIAVSPAAKDNLLALGAYEKKIHVIFNGMPAARECLDEEKIKLREKYNIQKDAFVLAQIARLTEVKGQEDVLNAAKEFDKNIIVLMAGDGDLKEKLRQRIKNENINNVRLLGFITEVEEIINIMDVQISASFGTEATSLALIQGMSVGKPAVVTDYGGNPYVIDNGENGLVVPTRSVSAMVDAVNKIATSPEIYEKISNNARKIYESRFTLELMVKNTANLYIKMEERK